jgi:hypothetical protein
MSSPITTAVRSVFKGLALPSTVPVFDYRDDFDALWGEVLESSAPSYELLVICGIDAPQRFFGDGLSWDSFNKNFTALSWAAAWRWRNPTSQVRVLVIGDTEQGLESVAGKLGGLFRATAESGLPLIPGISWFKQPVREEIEIWAKNDSAKGNKVMGELNALLRDTVWNGLTDDSSDHHGISNVLGAYLLRFQSGLPLDDALANPTEGQKVLFSLISSISESPNYKTRVVKTDTRPEGSQRWVSSRTQSRIKNVVLLDDMAALWEPVVRGGLGFFRSDLKNRLTISSPDFNSIIATLPERLNAFIVEKCAFLAKSDLFPGNGYEENSPAFVLILDLRLFSSRGGSEEKDFYERMIKVSKIVPRPRHVEDIEWQAFENDIEEIQNALNEGVSLSENVRALTLLPRLLSILDSTLPIVLFSSTHKRKLLEPLHAFPNIVTDFVKPVFGPGMSDWHSVVENTMENFERAMRKAATILDARESITIVTAIRDNLDNTQCAVDLPKGENGFLVEIFIDESEAPSHQPPPRAICAGGVVLIRSKDHRGTPLVSDEALWSALQTTNNLWGWCSCTPQNFERPRNQSHKRAFLPKGERLNFIGNGDGGNLFAGALEVIKSALGDRGTVFPFALIDNRAGYSPTWLSLPKGVWDRDAEKAMDMTLKSLIRDCLEALLFRHPIVVKALESHLTTLAIDLGCRDYPCSENQDLFECFGIEYFRQWRPSLRSEDGFLIAAQTCSQTGLPWPYRSTISRARAVALRDFASNEGFLNSSPTPRQLHYLADVIAHVALNDLEDATRQSPKIADFFGSGWVTDYRKSRFDECLLFSARQWDQGDHIGALLALAKRSRNPKNHLATISTGYGKITAQQARFWWRDLSSYELRELFTRHF